MSAGPSSRLQQSDRYLIGGARDLVDRDHRPPRHRVRTRNADAARPGRGSARSGDRGRPAAQCGQDARGPSRASAICRAAPACWRSGANVAEELLPLLPPERHRELRLVATAMAIAEREAAGRRRAGSGDRGAASATFTDRRRPARKAGRGCRALPKRATLRRFAARPARRRIRAMRGARADARAILWRLTILKLREGNPGFLARQRLRSNKARVSDPAFTQAIDAFARGEIVVVTDDDDRENEGDLIIAAVHATPEKMAFIIRHTCGIVCAPMTGEIARRLHLAPMVADSDAIHGTAFTISVDYRHGTTTGISADDRTATIRGLGQQQYRPRRFRPARPHLPADRQGWRRADALRATPRRRSICAGSPRSSRWRRSASWSTTTAP